MNNSTENSGGTPFDINNVDITRLFRFIKEHDINKPWWRDWAKPTQKAVMDLGSEVIPRPGLVVVTGPVMSGKTFIIDRFAENLDVFDVINPRKGNRMRFFRVDDVLGEQIKPSMIGQLLNTLTTKFSCDEQDLGFVTQDMDLAYYLGTYNCHTILEMNTERVVKFMENGDDRFRSAPVIDTSEYEFTDEELAHTLFTFQGQEFNINDDFPVTLKDSQYFVSVVKNYLEENGYTTSDPSIGFFASAYTRACSLGAMLLYVHNQEKGSALRYALNSNESYDTIMDLMCVPPAINSDGPGPAVFTFNPADILNQMMDEGMPPAMMSHNNNGPIQQKPKTPMTFTDPDAFREAMKKRVIGQDKALDAVADALLVPASGLQSDTKPLHSFIFAGPTGVGKTQTAQTIAENLCDTPMNVIRLDMGEFSEPHTAMKLFGAPPSFVGYENGGVLTTQVAENPQSVIIFDEIEKADAKVWDTLLQVLDSGRATNNDGTVIDFSQCVIIFTTNVGAHDMSRRHVGFGNGAATDDTETIVKNSLKTSFRPEFLNRIETIVVFDHLKDDDIVGIVNQEFSRVKRMVKDVHGLNMTFNRKKMVESLLLEKINPREYGAREIQRVVFREVIKPVSQEILAHRSAKNNRIVVSIKDGKVVATCKNTNTQK